GVDPLGLIGKSKDPRKRRPCSPAERAECEAICGSRGVMVCFVDRFFRYKGVKNGLAWLEWVDSANMTCSCNEEPQRTSYCERHPVVCLGGGIKFWFKYWLRDYLDREFFSIPPMTANPCSRNDAAVAGTLGGLGGAALGFLLILVL